MEKKETTAIDAAWSDQCRRNLLRDPKNYIKYGFVKTYKPVIDDAPYRIFDTMRDYREWCDKNLPEYLGYKLEPGK